MAIAEGASVKPRPTFSPHKRAAIFRDCNGICHICTRKIAQGEPWEIEHVKARGLQGSDEDDNLRPAHIDCHAGKTRKDRAVMAEADRALIRHVGLKKKSRAWGKRFGWRKTGCGEAVASPSPDTTAGGGRMSGLVLSLFPGIGLLDMAFEEEGFCVVRGPDLLWGGDVHKFHPPAGRFDGVIGGPPCQAFSRLVHIVKAKGQTPKPNLIPEFERIVADANPAWFVMENVPAAPEPSVLGYIVRSIELNNRWTIEAPEQNRLRRFSFGTIDGRALMPVLGAIENPAWERTVVATSSKEGALAKSQGELRTGISKRLNRTAGALPGQTPRRTIERCAELQGLPRDFLADAPFTAAGKYLAIGNGVPLPMGRAIAKAVKAALASEARAP